MFKTRRWDSSATYKKITTVFLNHRLTNYPLQILRGSTLLVFTIWEGNFNNTPFFFSLFETRALLQKPTLGFLAGVQEEEAERRGERERVSLGV